MDHLPAHGIEQVHALSTVTDQDSAANPGLSAALLREVGRRIARTLSAASSTTEPADAFWLPSYLQERAS